MLLTGMCFILCQFVCEGSKPTESVTSPSRIPNTTTKQTKTASHRGAPWRRPETPTRTTSWETTRREALRGPRTSGSEWLILWKRDSMWMWTVCPSTTGTGTAPRSSPRELRGRAVLCCQWLHKGSGMMRSAAARTNIFANILFHKGAQLWRGHERLLTWRSVVLAIIKTRPNLLFKSSIAEWIMIL